MRTTRTPNSKNRPKYRNLRHWNEAELTKAAELYKAGHTVDEIAHELRRTPIAVSAQLRWLHQRTTEENVALGEQVAGYRREGIPWKIIKEQFPNVTVLTLRNYCKQSPISGEPGAPRKIIDKQTVKDVVRMKDVERLSFNDIAAELGHSCLAVQSAYNKHETSAPRPRMEPETIQAVVRMRDAEHLTWERIASKVRRTSAGVRFAYYRHTGTGLRLREELEEEKP